MYGKHSGSAVKYKDEKHTFREIVGAEKQGKLSSLFEHFVVALSGIDATCIDDVAAAFPRWRGYCSFMHEFIQIQKGWYNGQGS